MLRCEQVPSAGDAWSTCLEDTNVAVHVPNPGLTRARIIKQNIGSAVTVEIGRSRQAQAQRNTWAPCRPHINIVVHIPDRGPTKPATGTAVDWEQQVIRISISVEIR